MGLAGIIAWDCWRVQPRSAYRPLPICSACRTSRYRPCNNKPPLNHLLPSQRKMPRALGKLRRKRCRPSTCLRAEPDGSFVVAGRAEPYSIVDLKDGQGLVVASGTVDRTGDFVLLSEKNLPAGSHELRLHARSEGGAAVSEEAAIVSIPRGGEVAVLAAVVSDDEPVSDIDSVTPDAPAPQTGPAPVIAIEAVEVENGQLAIAGAAEQGATVQVYLNNEPIGLATGTRMAGSCSKRQRPVAGAYDVRADVVQRNDGTVIARAAVPVLHQTDEQVEEANALQDRHFRHHSRR